MFNPDSRVLTPVHFRVRILDGTFQFAIKKKNESWIEPQKTAQQACSTFASQNGLTWWRVTHGRAMFGLQSKQVQELLHRESKLERSLQEESHHSKLASNIMARVSLKQVAAEAVVSGAQPSRLSYSAIAKISEEMLGVLQNRACIAGRNYVGRTQEVLSQFIKQPDIAKLLLSSHCTDFRLDEKSRKVVDTLIRNMRLAIDIHKNQRTMESRRVYQTCLQLISPEQGSGLVRATAAFYNLDSRVGLSNAMKLLAAFQIEQEGGDLGSWSSDEDFADDVYPPVHMRGMFVPGLQKTRSDKTSPQLLSAAFDFWCGNTRLTANARNVVSCDGQTHPVQWKENTDHELYVKFIHDPPERVHKNQLLVRGVTDTCSELDVRRALQVRSEDNSPGGGRKGRDERMREREFLAGKTRAPCAEPYHVRFEAQIVRLRTPLLSRYRPADFTVRLRNPPVHQRRGCVRLSSPAHWHHHLYFSETLLGKRCYSLHLPVPCLSRHGLLV